MITSTCAVSIALVAGACGAVDETTDADRRRGDATGAAATVIANDEAARFDGEEDDTGAREGRVPDEEARDYSWFTFGWSAASDPGSEEERRPVDELSVFSRSRRPADAVPQDALDAAEPGVSELERYEGEALVAESRLAIANAGSRQIDVYLVPTTKGYVCTYVVDPTDPLVGFSGCEHALAPEGYTVKGSGTDRRITVEGLVEDSVRRVEVELWDRRVEAQLGENAYYLEATLERSCPDAVRAIILHRRDGARRIDLTSSTPSATEETFRAPGCR